MVELETSPGAPETARAEIAVTAVLDTAPAWARGPLIDVVSAFENTGVCSLERALACYGRSIVIVDDHVLDAVEPSMLDALHEGYDAVVAITDSPWKYAADVVDASLPLAFLTVPQAVAHDVLVDILERERSREERLERLMRDAVHEFRTPLTVISEFVALCEDGIGGPLTDRQRSYLGHAQAAVGRLDEHFDDFRDALRMALGSLPLRDEPYALDDVLEAAVVRDGGTRWAGAQSVGRVALEGVDGARLEEAVVRTLAAARKLARDGEELELVVRPTDGAHEIEIAYRGFVPSDDDARVLREGAVEASGGPYRTVARVFGLGVEMARSFLALAGGDLRLEARADDGGAFVVRVPTCAWRPASESPQDPSPEPEAALRGR